MLLHVSALTILGLVSAIDSEASDTHKNHIIKLRDWSNLTSAITAVVDPRITEIDRFLHVVCFPHQTNSSKICRLIAEFPTLNNTQTICNTTIHISEQGKVDPWSYIVPLNDKVIIPWIDSSNNGQSYTLTIRSISLETCIPNDVSIEVGVTPLYTIVPFNNSFDVLYVRSDDGLNFSTFKASYDQSGSPIDKPIEIFAHIPVEAMQDESGFSYPFPHQLLPVSDSDPREGYFFVPFNSAFSEIFVLSPNGTIKRRTVRQCVHLPNLVFTSNGSVILTSQKRSNVFRALQFNHELNVINDVTYDEIQGRKFIRFFILKSGRIIVLSMDEAESSRAFYLEKVDTEGKQGKTVLVGIIAAESYNHAKFYFSYTGNQICVRALFSENFRPKKLYLLCTEVSALD